MSKAGKRISFNVTRYAVVLSMIWTLVIIGFITWIVIYETEHARQLARNDAGADFTVARAEIVLQSTIMVLVWLFGIAGVAFFTRCVRRYQREHAGTEQALEKERQRFFALLETLPAYVYLQAPDHSIRFANRYYRQLFGDTEGVPCYKSLWDRDEPCETCPTFTIFETHEPKRWEWSQASNGRCYEIYDYPFTDIDGSMLVLVMGIDITERKQAEFEREELLKTLESKNKELNQEKLFSEDIINSLPGIFYMFDEKRLVQWNRLFETVTGYPPRELSRMSGPDFFEGDDKVLIAERMQKVFVDGQSDAEAELVTKSGNRIPHYFTGRLCRIANTNYLVGLGIDITARKIAEKDREQLLKTLESKNKELQSIVYVASHDLKSPLINIKGFSGMLEESCNNLSTIVNDAKSMRDEQNAKELGRITREDIPEYLKYIQAGALKMSKLLDGLLQVSRVGNTEIFTEPLNMNKIINDIQEAIEFQLKKTGAPVVVDDLPRCIGDEAMVNQIFSNLIDNALKYLNPDRPGRIHVYGWTDDGMSTYCVEDNGIGIAENNMNYIFEIFHRLDPDDGIGGEGLGLSIVMRSLDRLDGSIRIESKLGKGSKFFVTLPGC